MMGYLTDTVNAAAETPTPPATGFSARPGDHVAQTTDTEDRSARDENLVLDHLRRLISERTGYPPELLADDADLEADLGIDSVKRCEVLGALQRAYPRDHATRIAHGMTDLRRTRTLRSLAAAVSGLLTAEGADEPIQETQNKPASGTSGQNGAGKPST